MSYRPDKITWADIREAVRECDRLAKLERECMKAQLEEARKDLLIPLADDDV